MTSGPSSEVRLAGDLGSWEVLLVSGGLLHLKAHAYSQDQDEYIFVALAEGNPRYEVELARIPVPLVARVRGG
jgi:hypothetical protein